MEAQNYIFLPIKKTLLNSSKRNKMFYIVYFFIWIITWLPLRAMYVLSDFLFPIVYYIARYRRNVVRKNLVNSFPEKSISEIQKIERQFYRFFCDLFIEIPYQVHMSDKEMLKRMTFINTQIIDELYAKNTSVMLMTAHYANWEWATSMSLLLPKGKPLSGIYKKLSSGVFDKMMFNFRQKYGGFNIETQELFRVMLKKRNVGEFCTYGMISDQTPSYKSIRHWMTFLNQDTPVLVGTEEIARKFNYPVVFMDIKCLKRGYYSCEIKLLEPNPHETTENEITEKYMKMLEAKIKAEPAFWLWSHKRWKYKKSVE